MSNKKKKPIKSSNNTSNNNNALEICELCHHNRLLSDFNMKKKRITLRICDTCDTADASTFFDTKLREYLSDTDVESVFSDLGVDSKGRTIDTVMVCDLHNVTDLFTYEEFNNITKNFNIPVIVLSFIPIKSDTRRKTQPIINNYNSYKTFMCFTKAYTPASGTKGKFIKNIFSNSNIKNVFLLDDNNINCVSAKKAGGTSILIPTTRESGKTKEEIKKIIEEYMRKINNVRKRYDVIKYITTLGFFNNEIKRKKRSVNNKKAKQKVSSRKRVLTSAEIEELKRLGTAKKLSRKKKKDSAAVVESAV